MEMTAKKLIDIKVVSDIMCPWCWIGKRNLETAIENTKDLYDFKVTWHPFLLRPEMPEDGIKKPEGYGPHTSSSQRLIQMGKRVGINFSYKCDRFPNTVIAHCALEYALQEDPSGKIQNQLQELLFKGYFDDGVYPDVNAVSKAASQCGLMEEKVRIFITDPQNQKKVKESAEANRASGVTGVPHFIFNGHEVFSGAQEPKTIEHAFKNVVERFPLKSAI